MIQNYQKIDSKILWAVGGLFGYLSGEEKRAPEIMTRNGLEWIFRLFVNPKRLFFRYVIGNPLFFVRVFKYRLSKK
ncbi:MAG: WecB/TagA/CpsF family glycosyltransferase [Ignavibacteriales bacterium]|nr:WecB/TagA/CpsF family glycosyltransferase [Ignavibacteriales bacterium]